MVQGRALLSEESLAALFVLLLELLALGGVLRVGLALNSELSGARTLFDNRIGRLRCGCLLCPIFHRVPGKTRLDELRGDVMAILPTYATYLAPVSVGFVAIDECSLNQLRPQQVTSDSPKRLAGLGSDDARDTNRKISSPLWHRNVSPSWTDRGASQTTCPTGATAKADRFPKPSKRAESARFPKCMCAAGGDMDAKGRTVSWNESPI